MSDTKLRKDVIKLAKENPELREHLLPLLKEGQMPIDPESGQPMSGPHATFADAMDVVIARMKQAQRGRGSSRMAYLIDGLDKLFAQIYMKDAQFCEMNDSQLKQLQRVIKQSVRMY